MDDNHMISLPNGGFASGSRHDNGELVILLNEDADILKCSQHGDSINALVHLEDGNILAASKKPDGKFRIYNSITGELIKSFPQEDHTTTILLMLPEGKVAAFSPLSHCTVKVFDPYQEPSIVFKTFVSQGVGNGGLLLHFDTEIREMLRTGKLSLEAFLNTDMTSLIHIFAKYREEHQLEDLDSSESASEGGNEEEKKETDEENDVISLNELIDSLGIGSNEESQADLAQGFNSSNDSSRSEILFFDFEKNEGQQEVKRKEADEANEQNHIITLHEVLASFGIEDENDEKSQAGQISPIDFSREDRKGSKDPAENKNFTKAAVVETYLLPSIAVKGTLFQPNQKPKESIALDSGDVSCLR